MPPPDLDGGNEKSDGSENDELGGSDFTTPISEVVDRPITQSQGAHPA